MLVFFHRAGALASRLPVWLERLLLVVVAWQLAGAFWLLLAPGTGGPALGVPRSAPERGTVSREAFLRWYGTDARTEIKAPVDYSLMAVIAGKGGAALLKGNDGVSLAVRVGDDIRPGSRLVAVEPTRIVIDQGGARQEIRFPQDSAEALIAPTGGRAPARAGAPEPLRITRGQMVAVMQGGNVAGWDKGLSSAPEGGIRVDKVALQPFAKLLRLSDGDVLKSVNKRPLDRVTDISRISYFFGQDTSVELVLVRNGTTMTQHYDIQP